MLFCEDRLQERDLTIQLWAFLNSRVHLPQYCRRAALSVMILYFAVEWSRCIARGSVRNITIKVQSLWREHSLRRRPPASKLWHRYIYCNPWPLPAKHTALYILKLQMYLEYIKDSHNPMITSYAFVAFVWVYYSSDGFMGSFISVIILWINLL